MPAKDDIDLATPNLLVPKKSGSPLGPIIAVVILVPALVWGVMDFVILPKLKSATGAAPAAATPAAGGGHSGGGSKTVTALNEHTADFGVTVVNLAGSGNSRYLRTKFVVASEDPNISGIIKENENPLRDAAITVLSAQTVDGMENVHGREVVRKALISQFNRLLGAEVINQIYFSEFVIQ
jgi:flagellar FliL protein